MKQKDLVAEAQKVAGSRISEEMSLIEKIDILEMAMMELLDVAIMTPPIGRVATVASGGTPAAPTNGTRWLMGDDPRLPKMPAEPTLQDFFRHRVLLDRRGGNHLLQSARLAKSKGLSDGVVLACLLHDISVVGLVRTDHGHWGSQLVAPYVSEEVAWAIKHHQALRYRAAPEYGYEYPELYIKLFGEEYQVPDYIQAEWDYCRNHKWYGMAMEVCLNDLYAFDPGVVVDLEEFDDIIGREFKMPKEGLGFDGSPVAHMWRTMIWPNNFL